jgi:hypothetical protein
LINALQVQSYESELPALIERASNTLLLAKTSGEVLEARDIARLAYDSAKSLGRIARIKGAHDEVIAAVRQSQADAALIEARASMRLADEYDAAQERGEVAALGDNLPRVVDHNSKATAADIGLRRDEIHAARKLRDAEAADPGKTERVLAKIVNDGEEPTKARLRKEMLGEEKTKPSEPADSAETKLRREFRKLSKEGQEDAYVGLTLDLQEAKAKAKKQAEEIRLLKEQVKSFEGDQAETIRRQANTIRHKESEVYRANDKAEAALKQVHALKKRVKELEAMGIEL